MLGPSVYKEYVKLRCLQGVRLQYLQRVRLQYAQGFKLQEPTNKAKRKLNVLWQSPKASLRFWSRSQAPRSARSQTPEAIVGQRLFAQKPAEDITWESNSNTSTESRSSYLLSRCASHVDRVFRKTCLAFLFRTERPTRSSALACLSAYKR